MNFLVSIAMLATTIVNRNFIASDYGINAFTARIVNPAPIVDYRHSPVIVFSVETTPDTGCKNMRIVADLDRWCALAIYCDANGEGTSTLTVTGDCDGKEIFE